MMTLPNRQTTIKLVLEAGQPPIDAKYSDLIKLITNMVQQPTWNDGVHLLAIRKACESATENITFENADATFLKNIVKNPQAKPPVVHDDIYLLKDEIESMKSV